MKYPRMVFRGDETAIAASVDALVALHASGFVATPLAHDTIDEMACYAPASPAPDEGDASAAAVAPASKKLGPKPKPPTE